jgi:ribosomal protein S18 acetylase RimI-like enzyme
LDEHLGDCGPTPTYDAILHLRPNPGKGAARELRLLVRGKTQKHMTDPEKRHEAPATVREATPKDAETLHALSVELAYALGDQRPRPEAVRARLRDLLEEPRARVLVAEGEGGILGAASLWIKPDLAHGDTVIEVPMLVVFESARRQGVGKLLVEEIQAIGAAENAALIELVATRQNKPAHAFYRSLGFVETDHVALEFVGEMRDPPDPEG